jgi:hypothetical protein
MKQGVDPFIPTLISSIKKNQKKKEPVKEPYGLEDNSVKYL